MLLTFCSLQDLVRGRMKIFIVVLNLIGFVILLFFCLVAVGLLPRLTSTVYYFSFHSIKNIQYYRGGEKAGALSPSMGEDSKRLR